MSDEKLESDDSGSDQQATREKLKVERLEVVYRDADKFLKDEAQIVYLDDLFDRLEDFGDREATSDLSIRKIDTFWELEARGFVLSTLCAGIYFAHIPGRQEIVILGVVPKDHVGQQLKRHHQIKMKHRLSHYLSTVAK